MCELVKKWSMKKKKLTDSALGYWFRALSDLAVQAVSGKICEFVIAENLKMRA